MVTYGHNTLHTKSRYLLIKWSRDKCKTLYLHFCNTYGHQTWTSRLCDLLIMWSREKWKKNYIWISTIPMATKPGRMVTYSQKTPHTKLHLITWSRDKYKTLYLHFWSTYDHKNPTFKVTWPFHDVVKW